MSTLYDLYHPQTLSSHFRLSMGPTLAPMPLATSDLWYAITDHKFAGESTLSLYISLNDHLHKICDIDKSTLVNI